MCVDFQSWGWQPWGSITQWTEQKQGFLQYKQVLPTRYKHIFVLFVTMEKFTL